MLIYKIIKDKLEDKDLESASRIECDDNNIVVFKIKTREDIKEPRKMEMVIVPINDENYNFFKNYYFSKKY